MSDDDSNSSKIRDANRRAVLARRARFVAAALAGVSVACGKTSSSPQPCLQVVATATAPQPCLNMPSDLRRPPDMGSDAATDASSSDGGGSGTPDASTVDATAPKKPPQQPPPQPTKPQVCLKMAPPPDIDQKKPKPPTPGFDG